MKDCLFAEALAQEEIHGKLINQLVSITNNFISNFLIQMFECSKFILNQHQLTSHQAASIPN